MGDKIDQSNRTKLRQRLKKAFDRSGMTQSQLAERTGAVKGTVSGWFNPSTPNVIPDGEKLARIPGVLGISGHWLLTGKGPSVPGGDGAIKRAERAGAREALTALGRTLEQLRAQYADDDATQ